MYYALFEIITVGLPFCAFKITTGIHFSQQWLVGLGIIDLIFNTLNFFSLLFLKKRAVDTCLLSFVFHRLNPAAKDYKENWKDLGNAADIFLSFSLVAFIIGAGYITEFSTDLVSVWNISVVLNVLGAGCIRLLGSVNDLKQS